MPHKRPTFAKVSDEMGRHAALLEAELQRWPDVRTGKMFGMVSSGEYSLIANVAETSHPRSYSWTWPASSPNSKQVQRAHVQMAARRRIWPNIVLPRQRGAISIVEVIEAEDRDQAIEAWCASVWNACHDIQVEIATLLHELLGVPTSAAPSRRP